MTVDWFAQENEFRFDSKTLVFSLPRQLSASWLVEASRNVEIYKKTIDRNAWSARLQWRFLPLRPVKLFEKYEVTSKLTSLRNHCWCARHMFGPEEERPCRGRRAFYPPSPEFWPSNNPRALLLLLGTVRNIAKWLFLRNSGHRRPDHIVVAALLANNFSVLVDQQLLSAMAEDSGSRPFRCTASGCSQVSDVLWRLQCGGRAGGFWCPWLHVCRNANDDSQAEKGTITSLFSSSSVVLSFEEGKTWCSCCLAIWLSVLVVVTFLQTFSNIDRLNVHADLHRGAGTESEDLRLKMTRNEQVIGKCVHQIVFVIPQTRTCRQKCCWSRFLQPTHTESPKPYRTRFQVCFFVVICNALVIRCLNLGLCWGLGSQRCLMWYSDHVIY